MDVSLSFVAGVGAVGLPVKTGEASGAYVDRSTVRFPVVTARGAVTLVM